MDHMFSSLIDRNPDFQIKGLPLLEYDPFDDTHFTIVYFQQINSRNCIAYFDIHHITFVLKHTYRNIHSNTISIEKIHFKSAVFT